MVDSETRALRRTTVVLLLVSVVRWGWPRPAPSEAVGGADDLPALLDASRAAVAETDERSRPLAPGEMLDANAEGEVGFDRLPGVGASTAAAIVAHRGEIGGFAEAADLLAVRGVGPATLSKIAPLLTFGPSPGRGRRARRVPRPAERDSVSNGRSAAPAGAVYGGDSRRTGNRSEGRVDVNRADAARLATLPGIGPALARRIVETRRDGPFRSASDLQRVQGIGAATVARLAPFIRVAGRE